MVFFFYFLLLLWLKKGGEYLAVVFGPLVQLRVLDELVAKCCNWTSLEYTWTWIGGQLFLYSRWISTGLRVIGYGQWRDSTSRVEVITILVLMILSPFMTGVMNGTVVIITQLMFLPSSLTFLLVISLRGEILGGLWQNMWSISSLWLKFIFSNSKLFHMGICLCLLSNHVRSKNLKSSFLEKMSWIYKNCLSTDWNGVIKDPFDFHMYNLVIYGDIRE